MRHCNNIHVIFCKISILGTLRYNSGRICKSQKIFPRYQENNECNLSLLCCKICPIIDMLRLCLLMPCYSRRLSPISSLRPVIPCHSRRLSPQISLLRPVPQCHSRRLSPQISLLRPVPQCHSRRLSP